MPIAPPFDVATSAPRQGWLARLLRLPDRNGAKVALRQLLATRDPTQITQSDVSALLVAYRVGGGTARELVVSAWRHALRRFLADDVLSDEEVAYLQALRRALGVAEDDVARIEAELIHPRFNRAVAEVLADLYISAEEREGLARLGANLRLSIATQTELFRVPATAIMKREIEGALADGRLSPDEMAAVNTVAEHLGLDVHWAEATQEEIDRCALLWRVENGDLPVVPVSINLQRGEQCHFVISGVRWHEWRKTTRTVGYHSAGFSVRIAKGLYYRVGATRPQRVTTEGLIEMDQGTLYLTSKRVLFDGLRKNTSIRLSNLISYVVYADGLGLEKGSGKSPILMFSGDTELAAVILGRLLAAT